MSDGGRERASLGVEVWKSSQRWSVKRSASLLANPFGVRSIAWIGLIMVLAVREQLANRENSMQ
jgi:hypothetical protein